MNATPKHKDEKTSTARKKVCKKQGAKRARGGR
eukprot:COSAG02_NODE_7752_length_2862_cov_2.473037_3_plen_33_part_00